MHPSEYLSTEDLYKVDLYLKNDCNAQKTYIDLGYSKKTAHAHSAAYFKQPKIRALINERIKKMSENVGVDLEWVLKKLKTIADRCIPDDAVKMEDVPRSDMVKGIAALSEISRIKGFYSPEKSEIDLASEFKELLKVNNDLKEKNKKDC